MEMVKCPVKDVEIDVPSGCDEDCMYLQDGECVNPLSVASDGGFGMC